MKNFRDYTHTCIGAYANLLTYAIFGDFGQLHLSRERRQILKIGPHYDAHSGQISPGTNFCVDPKSHREEKREQRKSARRPTDRPPDRPTDRPPATMITIPLWAFTGWPLALG